MKSMVSYEEALRELAAFTPVPRIRQAVAVDCCGDMLAEEVRLERDTPPFDRSTMDGYAIHPAAEASRFKVTGTVHAGEVAPESLKPGEAVRIMTGAPCPKGVAVIPIELTDRGTTEVVIQKDAPRFIGANVARRGEDGRAGDLILPRGHRLTPVTIAAAAMAGRTELAVVDRLQVLVITTGDEVGQTGDAGIPNSNGPYLVAFLRSLGAHVVSTHAMDTEDSLVAAFQTPGTFDLLVTVGGVSMGAKDLVPSLSEREGYRPVFHRVPIQPGKPVYFAVRDDGRALLGLPGNPVSVLATSHLFLRPIIAPGTAQAWTPHPLAAPFQNRGQRRLFLPGLLAEGSVHPVPWNGSGDLLAAASADGLLDFAPGTSYGQGEIVPFLPYQGHTLGGGILLPRRGLEPSHD